MENMNTDIRVWRVKPKKHILHVYVFLSGKEIGKSILTSPPFDYC